MDNLKKKCSTKKHSEIDAVIFCNDCKKYFCNKCKNQHLDILDDHRIINLNNINEIFIDECKENNHCYKYEFFCKRHYILCCCACITKIKDDGYGQHSDCDVCHIKYIKDEKKNKLKENLNNLEELYNQMEKSINEIRNIYEEINKNKEELKLKIQNIFTNIRNVLNNREDELLLEIDNLFNSKFFEGDLIKLLKIISI